MGKYERNSCCVSMVKHLFVVLNVLFVLIGVGIVGLGLYVHREGTKVPSNSQGPDVHYEARNISLALYILGGSITFLAFIGCCAAHKRWKVLLCCYWFILSALIAAQVVVGLYVVHQAKDGKIHERLSKVWHSASDGWRNEVQDNFSCCGFEDPSDDPGTVCPGHTKLNPDAGCFPVLKHDAKRVLHTVVIAALVLAGIEVFCLLASMCLLCCLNTKRVDPANQGLLNTPAPRSAYRATYSSRPYTEA